MSWNIIDLSLRLTLSATSFLRHWVEKGKDGESRSVHEEYEVLQVISDHLLDIHLPLAAGQAANSENKRVQRAIY